MRQQVFSMESGMLKPLDMCIIMCYNKGTTKGVPMEYISVGEFEELIDKDGLIDTLTKLGLIEKENTMHKLIKVTSDYWGAT